MLNRVVLVGRMVRDPELRRTPNGAAVVSFTLALNRPFTSQSGEKETDFFNCVVWNKPAENVAKYCSKGSLVGVDGQLRSRQYENQNGQKVNVVEVVANSVQFLETKGARENANNNSYEPSYQSGPSYNNNNNNTTTKKEEYDSPYNAFDIIDDDIEF